MTKGRGWEVMESVPDSSTLDSQVPALDGLGHLILSHFLCRWPVNPAPSTFTYRSSVLLFLDFLQLLCLYSHMGPCVRKRGHQSTYPEWPIDLPTVTKYATHNDAVCSP